MQFSRSISKQSSSYSRCMHEASMSLCLCFCLLLLIATNYYFLFSFSWNELCSLHVLIDSLSVLVLDVFQIVHQNLTISYVLFSQILLN